MTDKDHSASDKGPEETSPENTGEPADQVEKQVPSPENSEQMEVDSEEKNTASDTPQEPEEEAAQGEATEEETAEGETTKEETAKEETAEGETAKEETAKDLLKSDLEGVKIRKAKGSKNITSGICHVLATFNNTKVTFSDLKGNVISWSSSGKCNFRGSRKSTAYAAQVVTQDAGRNAMSHGMKEVVVKVKGPGMGRDSAVRTLQSLGFIISSIIDVTPVPHNGCRPPKRRRV